ncbi:unnamed protein product [Auanema sp. JU1783]|nr:unnamed protein product [Auanema sp. JU1783]
MNKYFFLIFLVSSVQSRLHCYDGAMNDVECEPDQLWCLKLTNSSGVYRGCTDVSEFCYAPEAGCYKPGKGSGEDYCCCQNKNLCNSSSSLNYFGICFTLFLLKLVVS